MHSECLAHVEDKTVLAAPPWVCCALSDLGTGRDAGAPEKKHSPAQDISGVAGSMPTMHWTNDHTTGAMTRRRTCHGARRLCCTEFTRPFLTSSMARTGWPPPIRTLIETHLNVLVQYVPCGTSKNDDVIDVLARLDLLSRFSSLRPLNTLQS